MTHSPQLGNLQSPCCPCVSLRSRSQLKVKYLTNKYYTLCRVCSITPVLMEGFPSNLNDTFASTRGCAEPMLPMCQLKVKNTVKGQIFNKQILHIMLCPLLVYTTNIRIIFSSDNDFLISCHYASAAGGLCSCLMHVSVVHPGDLRHTGPGAVRGARLVINTAQQPMRLVTPCNLWDPCGIVHLLIVYSHL